jgi:hypothetical protein
MVEVLALGGMIALYALLREYIAGRAVFIIPASFLVIGYACLMIRTGSATLRECGIGWTNLRRATALTLSVSIPVAIAMLWLAKRQGGLTPPESFYIMLVAYPLWGLVQQFIFQSFLHTRLIRLGASPWSIIVVAVAYGVVHLGSQKLAIFTFFGGIVMSAIFRVAPNIIPLGIAHGALGAILYHLVLGRNQLDEFMK